MKILLTILYDIFLIGCVVIPVILLTAWLIGKQIKSIIKLVKEE